MEKKNSYHLVPIIKLQGITTEKCYTVQITLCLLLSILDNDPPHMVQNSILRKETYGESLLQVNCQISNALCVTETSNISNESLHFFLFGDICGFIV